MTGVFPNTSHYRFVMLFRIQALLSAVVVCAVLCSGCCCPCGYISTTGTGGGLSRPSSGSSGSDADGGVSDEEWNAGVDYAQQALTKVGYGTILTADVVKSGGSATVSGAAEGLTGADVDYEVRFQLLTAGNNTNWLVKKVLVDGDTVFED